MSEQSASRARAGAETANGERAASRQGGPRRSCRGLAPSLTLAVLAAFAAAAAAAAEKAAPPDTSAAAPAAAPVVHYPTTIPGPAPFRRLELPDGPGEIFLFGTVAAAGPPEGSSLHAGWSLGVLFRPLAAADLFEPLWKLNTGIVMQAQGNGAKDERSLLAADFLFRRYVRDARRAFPGRSLFVGLGMGLARASRPGAGNQRWWSPLAEVGIEAQPRPGLVLIGRLQYRHYDKYGSDLSGWSVHLGAGVPLFF